MNEGSPLIESWLHYLLIKSTFQFQQWLKLTFQSKKVLCRFFRKFFAFRKKLVIFIVFRKKFETRKMCSTSPNSRHNDAQISKFQNQKAMFYLVMSQFSDLIWAKHDIINCSWCRLTASKFSFLTWEPPLFCWEKSDKVDQPLSIFQLFFSKKELYIHTGCTKIRSNMSQIPKQIRMK